MTHLMQPEYASCPVVLTHHHVMHGQVHQPRCMCPKLLVTGAAAKQQHEQSHRFNEVCVLLQIKIEFTQSSPFSFDLCPDNFVEESTEADSSNAQQQQQPAADPGPLQQQEHSAATLQQAGSADQQQQQQSPPTQADQSAAEPAGPGTTAPKGDPGPSHAAAMEPGQSPAESGAAAGVQPGPESEPGINHPEGGSAAAGASVPRKKLPLEVRCCAVLRCSVLCCAVLGGAQGVHCSLYFTRQCTAAGQAECIAALPPFIACLPG